MDQSIPEEIRETAKKYHLGQLALEEKDAFEAVYFNQDSVEWRALGVVASELEQAYVDGTMPDDEQRLFEKNYCPDNESTEAAKRLKLVRVMGEHGDEIFRQKR